MTMTAPTTGIATASPATVAVLRELARYEIRRYLRSPIFLVAVALTGYGLSDGLSHTLLDIDGVAGSIGSALGGFGMIAAVWLSQSSRRSAAATDVAPVPIHLRTAALCLTAIVPLTIGVLSLLAIEIFQRPDGPWTYGTLSSTGRLADLLSQLVLPALGGPLLGVAIGAWWRGPCSGCECLLPIRRSSATTAARTSASRPGGGRRWSSSAGSCACAGWRSCSHYCAAPRRDCAAGSSP
jgi:hypothetical protein